MVLEMSDAEGSLALSISTPIIATAMEIERETDAHDHDTANESNISGAAQDAQLSAQDAQPSPDARNVTTAVPDGGYGWVVVPAAPSSPSTSTGSRVAGVYFRAACSKQA